AGPVHRQRLLRPRLQARTLGGGGPGADAQRRAGQRLRRRVLLPAPLRTLGRRLGGSLRAVSAARRAGARLHLLDDQPAGQAAAGVAGGIGAVVVGLLVDHQARAAGAQQRVGLALLEGDHLGRHGDVRLAVLADLEVRQVAGVRALGVVLAVLL